MYQGLVLVDWNGDDLMTYATGSINLMPYPICRGLQQQTRMLDGVLCRAERPARVLAGKGRECPVESLVLRCSSGRWAGAPKLEEAALKPCRESMALPNVQ
jgi:hypothetical protein